MGGEDAVTLTTTAFSAEQMSLPNLMMKLSTAWSMPAGPVWFSLVNASRISLVQLGQYQQDLSGSAWSMPAGLAWLNGQCQQDLPGSAWSMPAGLAWFSLVNTSRTCLVQLGQCQQDLSGSAWLMPAGLAWFSLVNTSRTCLVQLGQCQQD